MKSLKKILEELMTTASTGVANTSNYVGTRRKRWGDSPDAFVSGAPGKPSKNKKLKKKENLGFLTQQRPMPFGGSGKYIYTPQMSEEENKMTKLNQYLEATKKRKLLTDENIFSLVERINHLLDKIPDKDLKTFATEVMGFDMEDLDADLVSIIEDIEDNAYDVINGIASEKGLKMFISDLEKWEKKYAK